MIQPLYNIKTTELNVESNSLLIEIGQQGVFIVVWNDKKEFLTLTVYSFSKQFTTAEIFENVDYILKKDKLLQHEYNKVYVVWSFNHQIFLPHEIFNDDICKPSFELVYGNVINVAIKKDWMYHKQIHNIYGVATEICNIVEEKFSKALHSHQYSLIVNDVKDADELLYVIFYAHSFTVFLLKNKELLAVQNYEYKVAEDVVYHLLNSCKSFLINAEKVTLKISGMIDTESNLFREINKYFYTIVLETPPEDFLYSPEMQKNLPHLFSHLYNIASCV
jgi:Protein of unknown function (DUF3822)